MDMRSYNTQHARLCEAITLAGSNRLLIGTWQAALARLERKMVRQSKRETKALAYQANGLNGPRAVARRLRQLECA